jgi:hypothetical protein
MLCDWEVDLAFLFDVDLCLRSFGLPDLDFLAKLLTFVQNFDCVLILQNVLG